MSALLQDKTPEAVSESPGLSSTEAQRRRAEFGANAVAQDEAHPVRRVLRHFWAPVPWMLEATVVLQIAIGQRLTAAMIAALLLFNVALGAFQENRANAALALLKQRLTLRSRVKRDGAWVDIDAGELVPGDILEVSLGDVIPADILVIKGSLLVDQSMLTGELVPAETGPGAKSFAGGLVRRGDAIAQVVATGARTYFGRTAELVSVAHVESAEQKAVIAVVRNLDRDQFLHRDRDRRLRDLSANQLPADFVARVDHVAVRGARRAARDLHAGGGPGRAERSRRRACCLRGFPRSTRPPWWTCSAATRPAR